MKRASFISAVLLAGCWLGGLNVAGATRLACTRLDEGHWQVWLAKPDGSNSRRLTSSPWDKRCLRSAGTANALLLRDNEGKLHRLDLGATEPDTPLALDLDVVKDFDFSPEAGFLIASYAPNALDNVCIWQVPREGRPKRLLVYEPFINELPRWLPSGGRFLFAKSHAGKSQLWIAEVAETKAKSLLAKALISASDPCPSPDGASVLFCSQGRGSIDLWICSGSGQDARELYAGPGLEAEPAWSLEGDWAYFTTWDGKNFRLARIRPNGSEFALVSEGGLDSRCPLLINVTGDQHE